ncbi:glucose 1-dehydrogenase [Rhizobium sp. P44RR-XXIV]|uniref:SDR family NAD(P)-dependent oxidoreductase n=1 Tax=Rhizobium sp. P44RR-XXIV TaxID=1921145 RepID=UPI0009868520|nr:glucose 1-dehydrogenase [Rhizobium sp. P44RR-XXIV]
MRLRDKVAVVTGGQRGIGFAIAEKFAREGAHVIIADIGDATQEAASLSAIGANKARFCKTDVGSEREIRSMVDAVVSEHGRIDVLVNNAGIEFYKPVTTTTEDEWDRLMRVNLKGVFLCSKAAIPAMRQSGGVIVNVASELGLVGEANVAAYCASKGGVVMLSKAMAIDHGPEGIRVNCLCPGPVSTQLLEDVFLASDDPEWMRQSFERRMILNRLGTPEECANAALFLASSESSFMAGANLVLDGGWTTR